MNMFFQLRVMFESFSNNTHQPPSIQWEYFLKSIKSFQNPSSDSHGVQRRVWRFVSTSCFINNTPASDSSFLTYKAQYYLAVERASGYNGVRITTEVFRGRLLNCSRSAEASWSAGNLVGCRGSGNIHFLSQRYCSEISEVLYVTVDYFEVHF